MTARETGAVERFFIEHGMIHDRVTGKHVTTEPVEFEEGKWDTSPVDDACALLNQLACAQPTPSATGEIVGAVRGILHRLGGPAAIGEWSVDAAREIAALFGEQQAATIAERDAEIARLTALLNTPEVEDFAKGAALEAAHQRERWGADHDAGKTPFDWFWLIGYLAQKAASAHVDGNTEKALHHTISTAAALANWHLALTGTDTRMRPGIDTPEEARTTLERTRGQ